MLSVVDLVFGRGAFAGSTGPMGDQEGRISQGRFGLPGGAAWIVPCPTQIGVSLSLGRQQIRSDDRWLRRVCVVESVFPQKTSKSLGHAIFMALSLWQETVHRWR